MRLFGVLKGKTSIKIMPLESRNDELESDAERRWYRSRNGFPIMLDPNTSKGEPASLRSALLAYRFQDTLAMVEIYRALRDGPSELVRIKGLCVYKLKLAGNLFVVEPFHR